MLCDIKIVHLSSVHPRYDSRIFLKECCSLSNAGYQISLVVADGKGDEIKNGVAILDVGSPVGRLSRMFKTTRLVFEKAVVLDAHIYHLHDPELLPIGLKLKKLGKTIIFDAHEDIPKQLLSKPYLKKPIKLFISNIFGTYEAWACKRFDAIVTATPFIRDKFLRINPESVDINNFPMLGELASASADCEQNRTDVCYVGGIAAVRGIREMVCAMDLVKGCARLQLGGHFTEKAVETEVKTYPGWQHVDELGWLDREGVKAVLNHSLAGLVTLHPIVNYIDALPVKMFEYMSAGIPVIASNFPLLREIIEENDCGVCVDPLNPEKIAEAIDFLVDNSSRARQMGQNGQRAVHERYNWGIEEEKLIGLYVRLSCESGHLSS
jgi:glycosyltransferase involved in cell wall biosynthesis